MYWRVKHFCKADTADTVEVDGCHEEVFWDTALGLHPSTINWQNAEQELFEFSSNIISVSGLCGSCAIAVIKQTKHAETREFPIACELHSSGLKDIVPFFSYMLEPDWLQCTRVFLHLYVLSPPSLLDIDSAFVTAVQISERGPGPSQPAAGPGGLLLICWGGERAGIKTQHRADKHCPPPPLFDTATLVLTFTSGTALPDSKQAASLQKLSASVTQEMFLMEA
ncbi:hypothetical protein EK904_011224 [Melospiza melodia maxima]|nr:hypothetical protein EK904_011224 [Melospiza melodia maxima]